MKRYLLFDAGCAVCNQIAQAIEEAAAGKLKAVSFRDPQAKEWLDQTYPAGWAHRPYLVTVEGDRVRALAGASMVLRLGWLLGLRKGLRVWNLYRRYGVAWSAGKTFSAERRGILKRVGGALAGLMLIRAPDEPCDIWPVPVPVQRGFIHSVAHLRLKGRPEEGQCIPGPGKVLQSPDLLKLVQDQEQGATSLLPHGRWCPTYGKRKV